VNTIWLEERETHRRCVRHEAFWDGCLERGPLLWVTVPGAKTGTEPARPATEEALWTDVEYVLDKGEYDLAYTHFAGDSLPVFHPWLGPDQFAAWLGAEMEVRPLDNTSWVKPFVEDFTECSSFALSTDNRWWRLYLELVGGAVERGRDKWITAYPDLHTGIDALAALRGPENLMLDLIEKPDIVQRTMTRMTELWKEIVDRVSAMVLPAGQGTSNWTMGWSAKRFLCVGQNDFSCLVSPEMFDGFCLADTRACVEHVDRTLYHLDGPDAVRHLPSILGIGRLNCVQWIQGAGQPLPSQWLPLLQKIQAGGKSVQLFYAGAHGGDADFVQELDVLCNGLDRNRLFVVIEARSVEEAEALVRQVS
jgi:hypothetical protein